jgi:predicted MFS family arabinose efflux permease
VTAATPSMVDRPSAIAAAALVTSLGALFFNLMPLVLGAVEDQWGWDRTRLGVFASAGLFGTMLATFTAPFWVRRVPWRRTIRVFAALCAAGYALAATLSSYFPLVIAMAMVGVAMAIAYAPAFASLTDTRDPSRAFGIMVFLQVACAALCALAIPGLEARFGVAGILCMLGALTLGAALLARWIPDAGRAREAPVVAAGAPPPRLGVVLALLGVFAFNVATVGVWGFLELIGNAGGIRDEEVAIAITVALMVGGLGALATASIGDRLTPRSGITIGLVGFLLSLLALHGVEGFAPFLAATVVLNASWNFSISYQMGLVSMLDADGRFAVLATAMVGLGSVIGPALGGWLATGSGFAAVLVMSAIAISLGAVLQHVASRHGSGPESEGAPAAVPGTSVG